MRASFLALLATAVLSACVSQKTVTADGETFPAAPVQIVSPQKGGPRVGSILATPKQAARIFNAACIDTLPNFAGAGAALTKFGMRADPSSGVYLNTKLNLSVAIIQTGKSANCSIIFATDQDPKKAADQLASYAVSKGDRLFVAVIGQTANVVYLNAQIAPQ